MKHNLYYITVLAIVIAIYCWLLMIPRLRALPLPLLLRGRWRLLLNQCPACKHGWSDPEKHCGICGDYDRKPDAVRKQCWLLAYKLHLGVLKLTKPTSEEKYRHET